jgi:hypothetical protein
MTERSAYFRNKCLCSSLFVLEDDRGVRILGTSVGGRVKGKDGRRGGGCKPMGWKRVTKGVKYRTGRGVVVWGPVTGESGAGTPVYA